MKRCTYRGASFDVQDDDPAALNPEYNCRDIEEPVGQLPRPTAPTIQPTRTGEPRPPSVAAPAASVDQSELLESIAQLFDRVPSAPLSAPLVIENECAWCRVTKKAAGWLTLIGLFLTAAWLAKKFAR